MRTQKRRDPYPKVYSHHAPEVECIGKEKAHETLRVRVQGLLSTATNNRAPGGQFVAHLRTFHGKPLQDGHTPKTVIEEMEELDGHRRAP